jgi:undecaprenyl-diphosphatase
MNMLEAMDQGAVHALRHVLLPWTKQVFVNLSYLGDPYVVAGLTLFAAGALAGWRRGKQAVLLLCTVAVAFGLAYGGKALVNRQRPNVPDWSPLPTPPTSSFPSEHALMATALYGTLALLLRRQTTRMAPRFWLVIGGFELPFLAGLMCLFLGLNYVTDVVAGWAGGASLAFAAAWLDDLTARGAGILPAGASGRQDACPTKGSSP